MNGKKAGHVIKAFKESFSRHGYPEIFTASGGFRGGGLGPPPLFVKYLQNIYKKTTEMSIQKTF